MRNDPTNNRGEPSILNKCAGRETTPGPGVGQRSCGIQCDAATPGIPAIIQEGV